MVSILRVTCCEKNQQFQYALFPPSPAYYSDVYSPMKAVNRIYKPFLLQF